MQFTKNYAGMFVLLVWCLFMGVTAISIGIGSEFPQLNTIASPFACPGGTMTLEQHAFTVSPVEHGVTQTWYCVNGTTGAKTELSLGSFSIPAGLIYGFLLFLAILALIRIAQRWPRAALYMITTIAVLFVVGITAWNFLDLFGAPFDTSQATPVAQAIASPTPVDFAHVVLSFGGEGTAPGLFQDAQSIAVDQVGNIYVEDRKAMQVQKFDPIGKYVSTWNIDPNLCPNQSIFWGSLRADRDGNLFVRFCGSILKFDGATGKLLAQFNDDHNSSHDSYVDEILYPDGGLLVVAQDASDVNQVILHLDPSGKMLARYPDLGIEPSKNSSVSLKPALGGSRNIFLLNFWDGTVYKFTSDGKYIGKFGTVGTDAGQVDYRGIQIVIDHQNRVYVANLNGIKIFDPNGTYIESMGNRSINGGIYDMQINDQNEIYLVTSSNMIYKLVRNTK